MEILIFLVQKLGVLSQLIGGLILYLLVVVMGHAMGQKHAVLVLLIAEGVVEAGEELTLSAPHNNNASLYLAQEQTNVQLAMIAQPTTSVTHKNSVYQQVEWGQTNVKQTVIVL